MQRSPTPEILVQLVWFGVGTIVCTFHKDLRQYAGGPETTLDRLSLEPAQDLQGGRSQVQRPSPGPWDTLCRIPIPSMDYC